MVGIQNVVCILILFVYLQFLYVFFYNKPSEILVVLRRYCRIYLIEKCYIIFIWAVLARRKCVFPVLDPILREFWDEK